MNISIDWLLNFMTANCSANCSVLISYFLLGSFKILHSCKLQSSSVARTRRKYWLLTLFRNSTFTYFFTFVKITIKLVVKNNFSRWKLSISLVCGPNWSRILSAISRCTCSIFPFSSQWYIASWVFSYAHNQSEWFDHNSIRPLLSWISRTVRMVFLLLWEQTRWRRALT